MTARTTWVPCFIATHFLIVLSLALFKEYLEEAARYVLPRRRILDVWFPNHKARDRYHDLVGQTAPKPLLREALRERVSEDVERIVKLLEYEAAALRESRHDVREPALKRFNDEFAEEVADLRECASEARRLDGAACEKEIALHAKRAFRKAMILTEKKYSEVRERLNEERNFFEETLQNVEARFAELEFAEEEGVNDDSVQDSRDGFRMNAKG